MSLTISGLHDVSGTLFDVVRGVEGDCLVLGDEDGGTRISGPKPWGGGEVIKRFRVDEAYGPIGQLEEENAELRELVRDALFVLHKKRYDNEVACTEVCPRWRFRAGCQTFGDGCLLEGEARDLGIELEL